MNDDQLRDALDRRSAGAQFRAEELLPAVRRGIGVRPQPARVARWAPFAGLAAAAVIVVALIIAFPGDGTVGGASPSPSLGVMTTDAFASALQSGSLDNRTVLVNGGIVPLDEFRSGPLCEPPGPCPLGQMENVQPPVSISADQVAAAATDNSGNLGTSWTHFAIPVRGTLLLSVDGLGGVEYLGRVVPNDDQLTWSAVQVKTHLDVNSQDLADVVLVNGWLTGVDVPAPCQTFPPQFPGLPDRNECGVDSWIADEPAVLTAQSQQPPSAIEVQPGAFADYAPDPTARTSDSLLPQRAIYAVARRLYGQFCASASPCWDWSVVGRLSQAAPNVAPPSHSAQTRISCADLDIDTTVSIAWAGHPTIDDATGLVASCQRIDTGGLPLGASNPNGDQRTLDIVWSGLACDTDPVLTFTDLATGPPAQAFSLDGALAAHRCTAPITENGMRVILSAPIDASEVILKVGDFSWPPGSGPTPSAVQTPAAPVGSELTCGNDMTLEDATGLVASCDLQTEVSALPPFGGYPRGLSVSPTEISAQWVVSPCRTQTQGSFDPVSSSYELAITDDVSTASSSSSTCSPVMKEYMTLALTLSEPLSSSIRATADGQALPELSTPPPSMSPSPVPQATGYSVQIAEGLQPNWTAAAAASHVFDDIKSNEHLLGQVLQPARIISVEAMRGRDVPMAISGPYGDVPIAWVVHAYGTFVQTHVYSGGPILHTEGWFIFDDAGSELGEALGVPIASP